MRLTSLLFGLLSMLTPTASGQSFHHGKGLTALKASEDSTHAFAKVELWWLPSDMEKGDRVGAKGKKIGTRTTMIPSEKDGEALDMKLARFHTRLGQCLKTDEGDRYIQLLILYDRKTSDPTDDLLLSRVLFQVRGDRAWKNECSRILHFSELPKGAPTHKLEEGG